jgi:type VI protein secretion system component VasK
MTTLTLTAVEVAHQAVVVILQAVDEVPAPEDVRPGWIALGSFLLLAVVTVLLWLSMRKQLGKIRFDEGADAREAAPDVEAEQQGDATDRPEEHLENGDQRT